MRFLMPFVLSGALLFGCSDDGNAVGEGGSGGAGGEGGSIEGTGTGGVAGNGGSSGFGGHAIGGSGGGITVTPNCGAQYDDCAGDLVEVCAADWGGAVNVVVAICNDFLIESPYLDDKPLCECVEGACSRQACVPTNPCLSESWIEDDFRCLRECETLCGPGNRPRAGYCGRRRGVCECYCLNGGPNACIP